MKSICFIGAGKMATAIAAGLVKRNSGFKLKAYDPSSSAAAHFKEVCGGEICDTLEQALDAEIVLLAVKPQHLSEAAAKLPDLIGEKLLLSIVAGVPIETLSKLTGTRRIVRIMPNTPALVGEGMSCLAPAAGLSQEDIETAAGIFRAVGKVQILNESLLDAVTGLSGSGPAFVLEFIMALADGGVYAGLPRAAAVELAAQTVYGAAKLAMESDRPIGALRDDVISPGGTTSRGCMALAENGFAAGVAKAVIKAAERSAELGKH
ncbi:MAG: pyrroline-5-carboxylate reductase [Lentisphaeria bacterium]|nr:pyrroline-5-carboxylate reductase [Lentisphaeria bacterium]MBQ7404620.1 pyrroline-5-carboxylate reductase [Lentisphaeria bacterium]